MKKGFFVLFFSIALNCIGQTIDSIIYIDHTSSGDNGPGISYTSIDSFANGLLIDSSSNIRRFHYSYDSLGQMINNTNYGLSLGNWVAVQETAFVYNPLGQKISKAISNGDPLQFIERSLYYYSGLNLSEEIYQKYTGSWQDRSRIEYTYDGNDSLLMAKGSIALGGHWFHTSTHSYYYDNSNNFFTDTLSMLNQSSGVFDYTRLYVTYRDSLLRDTSVAEFRWDTILNWVKDHEFIYHFDSLSNSYARLEYGFSHMDNAYIFFGEIDYGYNSNNLLTNIFYNDPDLCSDNEYFNYDSLGHLIHRSYEHICGTLGSYVADDFYYYINLNAISFISPIYNICQEDTVTLECHSSQTGNHYQWHPSTGLNNDTISSPRCFANSTTTYQLFITDSIGNIDTLTTKVDVQTARHFNILIGNIDTISICKSFTLTIDTGIPIPITYSWSLDHLNLSASNSSIGDYRNGMYILTGTFYSGCIVQDSISINFMNTVLSPIIQKDTCNKFLTVNYPGSTYTGWTADGVSLISGDTLNIQSTYRIYQYYTAEILDSNNCFRYSLPEHIEYKGMYSYCSIMESCSGACDAEAKADLYTNYYAPYQFAWSTGDTNTCSSCYEDLIFSLCSGIKTVTVTDREGCALTSNVTIQSSNSLSISVSHSNDSLNNCIGSITVTPTVSDSSYMIYVCLNDSICGWYQSDVPIILSDLCADTFHISAYYLSQYYRSCFSETDVTIDNNLCFLPITIYPESCVGCSDGMVVFTPTGSPPFFTSLIPSVGTQVNDTILGLNAGSYLLCVIDSGGCQACTNFNITSSPLDIPDLFKSNNIFIMPNPVGNTLFVRRNDYSKIKTINIYNSLGQKQKIEFSHSKDLNNFEINTTFLFPGIYFLELISDHQKIIRKLIKE